MNAIRGGVCCFLTPDDAALEPEPRALAQRRDMLELGVGRLAFGRLEHAREP